MAQQGDHRDSAHCIARWPPAALNRRSAHKDRQSQNLLFRDCPRAPARSALAVQAMLGTGLRALAAGPATCRWQMQAPQPVPLAPSAGGGVAAAAAAAAAVQAPRLSSSSSSGSKGSMQKNLRAQPAGAHSRRGAAPAAAGNGEHASGGGAAEAVVIVDHGSRKKESNDMLLEFVELYK